MNLATNIPATTVNKYKFTKKERDTETSYDYFSIVFIRQVRAMEFSRMNLENRIKLEKQLSIACILFIIVIVFHKKKADK